MVSIEIFNINEVEEIYLHEIRKIIKQKQDYFENLFKKYTKPVSIQIDFNKDKHYRVNIEINLKSRKVSVTEIAPDPVEALREAFSDFRRSVKRQLALERKDYLYKRKRYRQEKWKEIFQDLIRDVEESRKEQKTKYGKKVKNALKSVQKYLKKRLKEMGFTKKQIKAQLPEIMQLVESKFYQRFDPKIHKPEDLNTILFKITEEVLSVYTNKNTEEEGELFITEFEADKNAPVEENYEPELYHIEDFSEDNSLLEKVFDQMSSEEVDMKIDRMISELPFEEQAAVHLHFLEGFSDKEIKEVTGMPEDETQKVIENFRQKVEQAFKKEVS